jgi:hypothetical protein
MMRVLTNVVVLAQNSVSKLLLDKQEGIFNRHEFDPASAFEMAEFSFSCAEFLGVIVLKASVFKAR